MCDIRKNDNSMRAFQRQLLPSCTNNTDSFIDKKSRGNTPAAKMNYDQPMTAAPIHVIVEKFLLMLGHGQMWEIGKVIQVGYRANLLIIAVS